MKPSLLRSFFAYYRPHRRLFVLDFSCAVASGLLELAFPWATGQFVNKYLPSQQLATDRRRGGDLAGDLSGQYRASVRGQLLGARSGYFDRDRDATQDLQPPAKTVVPIFRQPEDGAAGRARDQGPGRCRRGRAPRTGRRVYRHHDFSGFLRASVYAQLETRAADGACRAADDVDFVPLRRGDDADAARTLFGRVGDFNARIEENVGGIRVVQAFAERGP